MDYGNSRIEQSLACAFVLIVVALAGCGDGRPNRVPISGTVTYKGKPVEGARVTFACPGGRPASGVTNAEGKFTVGTYDLADGAILGTHAVTVAKTKPKTSVDPEHPSILVDHLLPPAYRNLAKTPLSATVTADGENDFRFDLVD